MARRYCCLAAVISCVPVLTSGLLLMMMAVLALVLAIVDDLGAVIVIAVFYTESIALVPLAIAGGLFALLMMFNLSGIRKTLPYFIVAVVTLPAIRNH